MSKEREEIKSGATYTLKEAASVLNLHYNTVWKRVNDGSIKSKREGDKYLIKGGWLLDYLERGSTSVHTSEEVEELIEDIKLRLSREVSLDERDARRIVTKEWEDFKKGEVVCPK